MLKILFKSILFILIIAVFYLNIGLYHKPEFKEIDGEAYNLDVYHQLLFLKETLRNGAGGEMQKLFPEGFIFINTLYGLTWCNLIQNLDKTSEIYTEGIVEITWSIKEIHSPDATIIFTENLPLEYGAFYKGWTNYLLGSKLKIQSIVERDSLEMALFKHNCEQISTALEQSQSPYLESYRGQVWPADVTTAIASISMHDEMFTPLYEKNIKDWVKKVKERLDTKTGLISHAAYPKSGATLENARGSSQSLILNFLKDIDEEFATEQFKIYKKLFLDSRFGLPGIKEYPKGTSGGGDVDSGPVILSIGGAASIVGQRTMGRYENWKIYEGLRNSIETFGVGYTSNKKKQYIFGQLPMADAFIAWSNSVEISPNQVEIGSNWRLKFHLLSFVLVFILAFLVREGKPKI